MNQQQLNHRLIMDSSLSHWVGEFQGYTTFVDLLCFSVLLLLCLGARMFICALWSPAGKGLTSWLSSAVSTCEFVTFPLVSCVRCGTWLYRFLIFAPLLCRWTVLFSSCRWTVFNSVGELSFWFPLLLLLLLLLYLRATPLIYSGHKSVDLKYWLVYNKSSVLVIIIYTWCSKYIQLLITVFVGSLELSQCHHSFHM